MATTEVGSSLLLALGFIAGLGVIVVALLGYASTSTRSERVFRDQRSIRYAADAAIESAVSTVKDQPNVAIDSTSATPCYKKVPAANGIPDMVVTCAAAAGSGSGLPKEQGQVPKYAILALSQRDEESPNYQGSSCIFAAGNQGWDTAGLYGSNRAERGIRFSRTTFICTGQRAVNTWTVSGKVFSDSPIVADSGGSVVLTGTGNTIQARGGCTNIGSCTSVARSNGDPMTGGLSGGGNDPAVDGCGSSGTQPYIDCHSWDMPSLAGLTKQTVPAPSAAICGPGKVVTFLPGWYSDIGALNTLFKSSLCKSTTFWFAPGPGTNGQTMGPDYKQGLYYFDFTTGSGGGCNYYNSSASTTHQWCIGQAYDYNQHIVGGTPFKWDPTSAGGPGVPTASMTTSSIYGIGTSPFWSNQSRATSINGQSATYTNRFLAVNRPITLTGFGPQVPSGGYTGSVNIKVAHAESASFNTPSIKVTYDSSLFGSHTCGTYSLNRGTYSSGSPDQINVADQLSLGACLNQGDKLNTVSIQYQVSGCTFLCGSDPSLDGITIEPGGYPNQPSFPRPPTPDDPGGDCDATKPGVQFIFGGDSHMYIADGSVELCAGPDPEDPANRQQIAIRGVPNRALTLRPNGASYGGGTGGNSNFAGALRIAEPTSGDRGGSRLTLSYNGSNCGFCANTIEGTANLSFPAYTPPAGTHVTGVTVRAAYNSHGLITSPILNMPCGGSMSFSPSYQDTPFNWGVVQEQQQAPACMNSAILSGTTFTWRARSLKVCGFWICNGGFTDDLDGVELVIQLAGDNATTTSSAPNAVPNNGCLTAFVNYWNASQGGEADCALVKADQTKDFFNSNNNSRGRLSVKGTVYAPSAALDIDDEDVLYPWFSRGLVARTLMLRGFKYRSTIIPIASVPVVDRTVAPRSAIFTACIRGNGRSAVTTVCDDTAGDRIYARARVRFEYDCTYGGCPASLHGGLPYSPALPVNPADPAVCATGAVVNTQCWNQRWNRVPKIQWYTADR